MKKLIALFTVFFAFLFVNVEPASVQHSTTIEQTAPTASSFVPKFVEIELPNLKFSIGAPAQATEYNSDVGFDNSSVWMKDPVTPNLWTVSGSKANGNGATAMQMLMQSNPLIKQNHKFLITGTVANRTAGTLYIGVGLKMTGVPSFTAPTYPTTSIADTFTTSLGLHSVTAHGFDDSTDTTGAYRMICGPGQTLRDDPIVYPGMPGRSHLHQFYGNTGINAFSDYNSIRTKGMTTCGNTADINHPINRSGYWFPAMLDGVGHSVLPIAINLYYKTSPAGGVYCTDTSNAQFIPGAGGSCVQMPVNMRMIGGWKSSDNTLGVSDSGNRAHWQCWSVTDVPGAESMYLKDFMGPSHCALRGQGGNPAGQGGMIGMFFLFPYCWDGTHLDTLNHRDNVAWGTRPTGNFFAGCDNAHPYMIPDISVQVFWEIDANFQAGKWHLASDEMIDGLSTSNPGYSWHMDYWEGWSRTSLDTIKTYCWDRHNSCSGGDLGNGTAINNGSTLASNGAVGDPNGLQNATVPVPTLRYISTADTGMSAPITANGSFSVEITAAADGSFGLIGVDGFNGQVDTVHVTDITSGHKGPATVHAENDNHANDNLADVAPISFSLASK